MREGGFQAIQCQGVGTVAFGTGGVVVDFEEEAVDTGRYGGSGEDGDELGLAAGDAVGGGGGLDGVGAIEDDGGEGAQDGQGAHVDDEVVVAEGGAALGEGDVLAAGFADLADGILHVGGGDELALFDVDGATGLGGGDEEVRLAAKEGGDLQHGVDVGAEGVREAGAVIGSVDVGEDGETGFERDGAKDAGAFEEAGAAEA